MILLNIPTGSEGEPFNLTLMKKKCPEVKKMNDVSTELAQLFIVCLRENL